MSELKIKVNDVKVKLMYDSKKARVVSFQKSLSFRYTNNFLRRGCLKVLVMNQSIAYAIRHTTKTGPRRMKVPIDYKKLSGGS